jgi:hypothetical protein
VQREQALSSPRAEFLSYYSLRRELLIVWSRLLVEFRIHSKLSATTHRPNLNPTSVTSTDQLHLTQTGAALGPLPTKSITIWTPLPVCPYYFPAFVYLALKHAKKQTSSANHQTLINRQTKMRPTINALFETVAWNVGSIAAPGTETDNARNYCTGTPDRKETLAEA